MASMRTILSSKRFAAWLAQRAKEDPEGRYHYFYAPCAIEQYLTAQGVQVRYVSSVQFFPARKLTSVQLPSNWDRVASGHTPKPGQPYPRIGDIPELCPGWTWKAAAQRARKLLLGGRTRKAKTAAQ